VEIPDVEYARSGDLSIAYQVIGEGPIDIIFVRGFAGELLSTWEQPRLVRFVRDLARFGRVILIDKRGQGLSDRVREVPTLEARMDDLRAVMDDADSRRALLWSAHEGARLATLFAATYPERTSGLVLFDPEAKGTQTDDYPWARSDDDWDSWLAEVRNGWGRRAFLEQLADAWAPSETEDPDFREWFVSHMRRSLSPGAAVAFCRAVRHADASDVMSAVRVPTVVLHSPAKRDESAYTAERIPGASLVELPGQHGNFSWLEDTPYDASIRATEELVARLGAVPEPERVLATVLFTDIVGATDRAAQLGDAAWRELLARHHAIVRHQLAKFKGDEVDTAGDGFFATFDGPARAIRCGRAIASALDSVGLAVRIGVHTGECELVDGKVGGIAVHLGARVAAAADPGEVLVTSTVKDLVAGSGLEFADRGEHELKGVPGEWRLYAVHDG
jgi:class 3 adenylate cyclase/alpha-beta hydrolase superfamily lysophospholipase